jgi:predicted porin
MKCMKLAAAAVCVTVWTSSVRADEVSDLKAQVQVLQEQMNAIQQQLQKVAERLAAQTQARANSSTASASTPVPAQPAAPDRTQVASSGERGSSPERKSSGGLTFHTPGGEMTVYGKIDISLDGSTKGLNGMVGPDGGPPVGIGGWLPGLSTNLSYVGVRGFQTLNNLPFKFIYQLETQIDITASAGTGESNSSESNLVKGALTSRNSYIGLASEDWGSIKLGKSWAPYRLSTDRMNPFSGMQGDYQVIMGNTGGDNRVEFGTRLDHAIWYESPNLSGFSLAALYSPGQNRASNSDNIAGGESDCTGGNVPGSGGIVPVTCSDGSFSDAVSASVAYEKGPLYIAAAYERHMKVNRSSDITGLYGSGNAASVLLAAADVADEDAAKAAVQYALPTKTTIGGIFETMHRYVPTDLQFQNERQRNGSWLVMSQPLNPITSIHLGWAHAFRTPGDPGQHNDSLITPPGGVPGTDFTAGAHANNTANMLTAALKYQISKSVGVYGNWAMTVNGPAAHFDLGAGGRGLTTDCHDAFAAAGGLVASNPHCWTGSRLMGVSIGMNWKF